MLMGVKGGPECRNLYQISCRCPLPVLLCFGHFDDVLSGHTCFIAKCAQARNFCSRGSHPSCPAMPGLLLRFCFCIAAASALCSPGFTQCLPICYHVLHRCSIVLFEVKFLRKNLRYHPPSPLFILSPG